MSSLNVITTEVHDGRTTDVATYQLPVSRDEKGVHIASRTSKNAAVQGQVPAQVFKVDRHA